MWKTVIFLRAATNFYPQSMGMDFHFSTALFRKNFRRSCPQEKFPQFTSPVDKILTTKGICYFLVAEQESNQRSQLKEALSRLLPQSKPPSLRIHPTRIAVSAQHLNSDSVQAENVPIFCLKFDASNIGRAAFTE